jgi:hypothetical protein
LTTVGELHIIYGPFAIRDPGRIFLIFRFQFVLF